MEPMTWILLGIVLLVVLGVLASRARVRRGRGGWERPASGDGAWSALSARRRCLACHGTGWTGLEPERTFDFVGDGFEDKHSPATVCAACGGTGRAPGRTA
jgi:hypothetical protein